MAESSNFSAPPCNPYKATAVLLSLAQFSNATKTPGYKYCLFEYAIIMIKTVHLIIFSELSIFEKNIFSSFARYCVVVDVFHLYFFPSVLGLSIGCFRLNLLISFFGCLYFFETRISFNEMRYSQRNLVLAFGSFSLLMLLIYWILGEMLFKENVRNTVPVSSRKKMTDIHNFTLLEDGLWQSFKRHYLISSVISQRNNNQSTFAGVACASEVYLTTCGNPGMAALILMSLDHISVCLEIGGMPTVFWRNCYTVCPSNASINAWELYFEPVNPNIEKHIDKVYCLGSYTTPEIAYQSRLNNRRNNTKDTKSKGLLPLSFHRRDIEGFDGIITRNVRLFANSLINRYIRVLPKIEMIVNDFYSKHMDKYNLLAVHIRGTDHGAETMDGKLPSLITWIKNAKYQLDSLPSPKRIFVASDNIESINKFVAEFGDKVIFTSAYRAKHYSHGESVHTSNYDPYKLGSEVLIDILLMAKCKHFLHAESSVAALVTYFNPNMHSHFLDYYIVQEANKNADKKSHGKSNTDDEDNNFDEHKDIDPSEIIEAFECFKENSPFSACKDMAKGKFLDISGG